MRQSAKISSKKRSYQKAERAGKYAELLICLIYCCRGFWPIGWRHRTIYGEIDLVMRRGSHIRFVEVKYRKSGVSADNPISAKQMIRLQQAALALYARLSPKADMSCQFDMIVVRGLFGVTIWENHISLA